MRKPTTKHKRIVSYDITRMIAIILVVLCHSIERIYRIYFTKPELAGDAMKIFASIVFTLGRLGVPLFLFLTGALILKKQINQDDDVIKFYKRNLLPLVIVNTVWVVIYNIFFLLNGDIAKVSFVSILKELLFLKSVPLGNMWYIPMIVGIYIGLPFVAKIVKSFSIKSLRSAAILIFIVCFILPFINVILKIIGVPPEHHLSSVLNYSFLGGIYGLYILIGYWLTTGGGN